MSWGSAGDLRDNELSSFETPTPPNVNGGKDQNAAVAANDHPPVHDKNTVKAVVNDGITGNGTTTTVANDIRIGSDNGNGKEKGKEKGKDKEKSKEKEKEKEKEKVNDNETMISDSEDTDSDSLSPPLVHSQLVLSVCPTGNENEVSMVDSSAVNKRGLSDVDVSSDDLSNFKKVAKKPGAKSSAPPSAKAPSRSANSTSKRAVHSGLPALTLAAPARILR